MRVVGLSVFAATAPQGRLPRLRRGSQERSAPRTRRVAAPHERGSNRHARTSAGADRRAPTSHLWLADASRVQVTEQRPGGDGP